MQLLLSIIIVLAAMGDSFLHFLRPTYLVFALSCYGALYSLLLCSRRIVAHNSLPMTISTFAIFYIFALYLYNIIAISNTISFHNALIKANYVINYAYFPIFIIIFSSGKIILHKLLKLFIIVLAIYYILYNVSYYINFNRAAHNAFSACVGLMLLSIVSYNIVYNKHNYIHQLLLYFIFILLILMPILAVLRGATFTMLVIIAIQIFTSRKHLPKQTLLILLGSVVVVLLFSNELMINIFTKGSEDFYNYDTPLDMVSALNTPDPNRDVRLGWWISVQRTFRSSPLWGTALSYTFSPFGRYTANASMLHNYYLSMIVDGGLLLFLPHLFIIIAATRKGIKKYIKGHREIIMFLCWNIAIISTYFSNAYGHRWDTSVILSFAQAYIVVYFYT